MEATDSIPEFGIKRENEERRDGGCAVVFDPASQLYAVGERAKDAKYILFSGGVDAGEDIREGILREVREESGLYDFLHIEKIGEVLTHYRNINKNVNRVAKATCLLVISKSKNVQPTQLEVHEQFVLVWKSAQEILDCWRAQNENENYSHWIYFLEKAVTRAKELGYDNTNELA